MKEARYEDPRHPDIQGKIVCVIPLFIPPGRKKGYGHWVEDKFESLCMTLAAHEHFKSGVDYDLVLVDNGSPRDVEVFEKAGYRILHRENEGYGFGAWKHAWEVLRDEGYDFFLFTEDDNAPTFDGWLADIVSLFLSRRDVGAVGNFVEAHGHFGISDEVQELRGTKREGLYCFDGAFTFTSASVLRQVDAHGGLPVYPCQPHHERSATVNELAFQQPILELGYALVSYSQSGRLLIHGSELYSGDLLNRGPMPAPIINHNARRRVPEVAKIFEWYEPTQHRLRA